MNLRLEPAAERALRERSEQSGRSQQELVRTAVDRLLGVDPARGAGGGLDDLVAAGLVQPPRTPYRRPAARVAAPTGTSTAELLDRDDRI